MELLLELKRELNLTYIFISHDIDVVYQLCDRIMVMKEGHVVETGETKELFEHPKDAYTRQLIDT
jgi:peptide/nickel transport system ATP-binding protein